MKSDLKAISTDNNLFIYADDTTLLVPELSAVDIVTEFNLKKYTAKGNMPLTCCSQQFKTKPH